MTLYMTLLTIIFITREYLNHKQSLKHDELIDTLTNKLMARDFTEYQEATQPPRVFEPVSKDDDDMYYQEIEDNKR